MGEVVPVIWWGEGIAGPEGEVFPRPQGWLMGSEEVTLDNISVADAYECYLNSRAPAPNCEANWQRYFPYPLPWEEIWTSFSRPGIYTPHHFMTFFKVLHRALPTNTRFPSNHRCRLRCGRVEHFAHWSGRSCWQLRKYWRRVTQVMTAFGCGKYRPSEELIFFTLKRVGGQLVVINRHMRGVMWLAWKFLWQQLAAIGNDSTGNIDFLLAFTGMWGMHHSAVLAALMDYRLVQQAKQAGARKYCKQDQEDAEKYRVWPFVTISHDNLGRLQLRYTKVYWDLLEELNINRAKDILPPS